MKKTRKRQKSRKSGCIVLWLFWLACFLAVFLISDVVEAWIGLLGFIIQSALLLVFIWIRSQAIHQTRWQYYITLWLTFFVPELVVAVLLSNTHDFTREVAILSSMILSVFAMIGYDMADRLFGWDIWPNKE